MSEHHRTVRRDCEMVRLGVNNIEEEVRNVLHETPLTETHSTLLKDMLIPMM